MAIEHGVGLLVRFRAHDVGDAEPLLIAVVRLDHAQHQHGRPDAQRAAAGEIERAVAFRRVVDDDQEFRRVPGLVAAALLAHRLSRPLPESDCGSASQQLIAHDARETVATSLGVAQRRIVRRTVAVESDRGSSESDQSTLASAAHEADDVLDRFHGVGGDDLRARGAVGEHRIDMGGVGDAGASSRR